jgi:crotonobetainyl-CoA:carnitine CoA-transferase CaiB-like acyl-CoA transferase
MVKDVDIVVENFSPGVMENLGLSYKTLEKINPALVMTSISNFGQTGPYRDYKASELIMNGYHAMQYLGNPEREPQTLSGYLTQYQTGVAAASVSMAAFLGARYKGIGQHVDISIMESMLHSCDRKITYFAAYSYAGLISQREPIGAIGLGPLGAYQCKDGYVQASIVTPKHWAKFCGLLESVYGDNIVERFPSAWELEKKEEFYAVCIPFFLEHTKSEIHVMAREAGIAIAPMNTTEDVVNDPHLNERGFFIEVDHPVAGKIVQTGAPFKMSETPWQIRRPAPLLGQNNEEVYGQMLEYTKEDLLRLAEMGII